MTYREEQRIINMALARLEPGRQRNIGNELRERTDRNKRERRLKAMAVDRQMQWRARHRKKYNRWMRRVLARKREAKRLLGESQKMAA